MTTRAADPITLSMSSEEAERKAKELAGAEQKNWMASPTRAGGLGA